MADALVIYDNLNIVQSIKYGFTKAGLNCHISSVNKLLGREVTQIKTNQFVVLVVTESLRKSIAEVNVLFKNLSTKCRFYLLFEGNFDRHYLVWAERTKWVFKSVAFPNSMKLAINVIAKFEAVMISKME